MASIKKRVLLLSSGKQIKLQGHCLCIANTLEVGEGFTKSILSANEAYKPGGTDAAVINPFGLTKDEFFEVADYNIFQWMELKDKIRQHGLDSIHIFKRNN